MVPGHSTTMSSASWQCFPKDSSHTGLLFASFFGSVFWVDDTYKKSLLFFIPK